MINDNLLEKSNFRNLIETDGIDDTEDRLNVIDAFLSTEAHVTLEDLMQILRARGYDYESGFVRRCMNRWVAHGFAQKEHFDGQPPRYEHRHLGKHHDHLICTKCGKIEEFRNDDLERFQLKIAAQNGFHMLQHKMEIYGICKDCLSRKSPFMPLAMAKTGERVLIREILGGREAIGRLSSMGFRCGDLLEIINNNGQGRLIVAHDCSRLALGRGIAQKVMVSLAAPEHLMECEESRKE